MPTYRYAARDAEGRELPGIRTAASIPSLVERLGDGGLTVTTAEEVRDRKEPAVGRIGVLELAAFYRQLADLIRANAPLPQGLRLVAADCSSRGLARAIDRVRAAVEEGLPLSQALGQNARVFGRTASSLARAGEASGALADTLASYADHLERFGTLRYDVAAAMTYPAMVALVAASLIVFLLILVLPRFMDLFHELGVVVFPAPTRILTALSDRRWVGLVLVVCCLFILALIYLLSRANRSGRGDVDALKLRIPVFGRLIHAASLAQLSSTLAVLVRADVPLITALELAGTSSDNAVFRAAMREAQRAVREGHSISRGIESSRAFPSTFIWRASVGEAGGRLAEALESMATHYQHIAQQRVKQFASLVEPLLIVFIGVVIGCLIAGMFLPLITIIEQLSGG